MIGSFRLPTHRSDGHRKFFDGLFLKNRIEISVKGDTCVLLGVKGVNVIQSVQIQSVQDLTLCCTPVTILYVTVRMTKILILK